MAESKKGFPMLPIAHWWNLRKKFRQSLPGVVTGSYLATVLNMAEKSANANILPFLKTLGIIDDDGKTTERAKLWRDDQHYPEVCSAILKDVYPTELLEAVTNPMEDREAAERWFARQSGSGEAAAGRMAALYSVLVEADATKQPDQEKRNAAKNTSRTPPKTPKTLLKPTTPLAQDPSGNPPSKDLPAAPGVHINLEIHISADASADQIDLIFAAMAKHIYKRV